MAQGWNVLSKTQHIATGKNTTMEHYLKVVHTTYLIGSGRGKNLETYQYTVNNNNYEDGELLPAANPSPNPNPSPSPHLEEGGGEADVPIGKDAVAQRTDTWES